MPKAAAFPIREAAFTGFRVIRDRPGAVAIWAVVYFVWLVAGGAAFVELFGPAVAKDSLGRFPTPGELALWPWALVIALASVMFNGTMSAAMNRVVLFPAPDRFGYLRLNGDVLRQSAVTLAAWASMLVASFAVALLVGLIGVGLSQTKVVSTGREAVSLVIGLAFFVGAILVTLLISAPLTAISAATSEAGRLEWRAGAGMARRRFWRLVAVRGLALIPVTFLGCAYLFGFAVLFPRVSTAAAGSIPFFEWGFSSGDASLARYFTTTRLTIFAARAVLGAICWPLMMTPFAAVQKYVSSRTDDGMRIEDAFT